ncbi:MAG TPA: arginase family protein [Acidimicrobiia bacterium]|nr:arginase family protein [Acidimicrobiia bacterium]
MTVIDRDWPSADAWLTGEDPEPDLVVVGVPNSRSSLVPSNAALAPLEMRQRLRRFSTFQAETQTDLSVVKVRDLGNWPVSEIDPVPLLDDIGRWVENLPVAPLHIYLGGDNAITRPLVAARSADLNRIGLITFDAHHDVRSLDAGPSNGNPIRGLIEEHGLRGSNIVQIGIHSFANSGQHRSYCEGHGVTTVTVDEIGSIGMTAAVEVALAQLSSGCDQIYVDVDVDVLDRVFAPACPGARPGGLTVRQLALGVTRCAAHPVVRAMDIVEVDPSADRDHQTVDVMAHLFLSAVAGFASRSDPGSG